MLQFIGGDIVGEPNAVIKGVAPFHEASAFDITFADSFKILKKINETNASAVIVPRHFTLPAKTSLILSDNPRLAFAKIMTLFFPVVRPGASISALASIGRNFASGKDVYIGPSVTIENNVGVGDRVVIRPNVYIGRNVRIGNDVNIYPNVSIMDGCVIGNRVTIHAGSVIGSDGFGFVTDGVRHSKIPQVGIVQIDDDVEIGANNTIDRATFGKTWIKQGVKTDNLVHIGHNVLVGENSLMVAQVGISGSTTIGNNVILAGQAGISGHLSIGDRATVGPQAGVIRSVPPGEVVSGTPEMPHRTWLRVHQIMLRLPELKNKIADIEKRLKAVEEQKNS